MFQRSLSDSVMLALSRRARSITPFGFWRSAMSCTTLPQSHISTHAHSCPLYPLSVNLISVLFIMRFLLVFSSMLLFLFLPPLAFGSTLRREGGFALCLADILLAGVRKPWDRHKQLPRGWSNRESMAPRCQRNQLSFLFINVVENFFVDT